MIHKFGLFEVLLPGSIILLLLASCANYKASQVEESAVPPVTAPEVENESKTLDSLLKKAYRMTSSADQQYSAIPDDSRIVEKAATAEQGENNAAIQSLAVVKNLVPGSSPEFAALTRQSFDRVMLDTTSSFTLIDAAVLTVQLNRDIKTSYAQYQQSLGSLEIARGNFDLTVQAQWNSTPSYAFAGKDSTNKTDTSLYSFGVSKLSRFGLQTDATFSFTGQDIFTRTGNGETGEGDVALVFSMPLLKDFGTMSTAAEEQARMLGLNASLASVVHQMSVSLKEMIGNYWDYTAAVQNLLLSIDALEKSKETLKNTTILVENDFQESSSLHALKADVASKDASRRQSEQKLVEARNQLAIDLGFPVKIAHHIPMPTSEFSGLEIEKACRIKGNLPLLLKTALAKRQDYKTAELQMKSSVVMEAKYRRDVLPDVNLIAGVTHTGFNTDSSVSEAFDTVSEGDSAIQAGVQVALPWTNDAARGQLRSQMGQTRALRLAFASSEESITSDINDNAYALFNAVEYLNSQALAVKEYNEATVAEYKKFNLGLSSILDIINVADRLNNARVNMLSARADLATAITNLRYSTGTLLNDSGHEKKLSFEDLSLPLPPSLIVDLAENGTCN